MRKCFWASDAIHHIAGSKVGNRLSNYFSAVLHGHWFLRPRLRGGLVKGCYAGKMLSYFFWQIAQIDFLKMPPILSSGKAGITPSVCVYVLSGVFLYVGISIWYET